MLSFLFRKEIMNEKKQEDLILAIKTSIKNDFEYRIEKSYKNSVFIVVYSTESLSSILHLCGTLGAFFNYGKAEEVDEIHAFEYEISITDYGLDLSEVARLTREHIDPNDI